MSYFYDIRIEKVRKNKKIDLKKNTVKKRGYFIQSVKYRLPTEPSPRAQKNTLLARSTYTLRTMQTNFRQMSKMTETRPSNSSLYDSEIPPQFILYTLPPSSNCVGSKKCLSIVKQNDMDSYFAPTSSGLKYASVIKVINAALLDIESCPEWLVGVPTLFETGNACVYKGESACTRLQAISMGASRKYWVKKGNIPNTRSQSQFGEQTTRSSFPNVNPGQTMNPARMPSKSIRTNYTRPSYSRTGQSMTFDSKKNGGSTEELQRSFASRQGQVPASLERSMPASSLIQSSKKDTDTLFKKAMSTAANAPTATQNTMIATAFDMSEYNTDEAAEHKLPESVVRKAKMNAKKVASHSQDLIAKAKNTGTHAMPFAAQSDGGHVDLASAFQKRKSSYTTR